MYNVYSKMHQTFSFLYITCNLLIAYVMTVEKLDNLKFCVCTRDDHIYHIYYFWVFGMTRPGIEPWSPGSLANIP